jgi:serine phosphatase RsbU (regulator of sigma subunit)
VAAIDFGQALRAARDANPAAMPDILTRAASGFGATDVVVYLVDFSKTVLEPMPDRSAHADVPETEPLATTMAGRAFVDQKILTADRHGDVRVWIPLVEGSDHTGVIALSLPSMDDGLLEACAELGTLAGYLIAVHARCTDIYNLYRRRRSMSLAASMQWDILPPLILTAGSVSVAGLLEPAYDIGGDCFDYAVNGSTFDFAIMDAVGRGLEAARMASMAISNYRHDRREGRSLAAIHSSLGSMVSSLHLDPTFVTGLLARIDLESGAFTWTNAGHPLPLLIRQGRVIAELRCPPTPPWGVSGRLPSVTTEQLEPGDCVFAYTDGITEARTPDGEFFGVERLTDILDRHAAESLRPEEILARVVGNVQDHRGSDDLGDDATALMVRWEGSDIS